MRDHEKYEDLLPFYLTGEIDATDRMAMEGHLATCEGCREDAALWRELHQVVVEETATIPAPQNTWPQMARRWASGFRGVTVWQTFFSLLKTQAQLVRSEIWSASFLIIAIGFVVAVLLETSAAVGILAPLVAAAGVGVLYGQENDPAFELTLATPVSQSQILLARLVLVFGYDLLLVVICFAGLTLVFPEESLVALLSGWLAPMTFLSSLALVLSLIFRSGNAISAAYILWFSRFVFTMQLAGVPQFSFAYYVSSFWMNSSLLFMVAGGLFGVALILIRRGAQPVHSPLS